MLRAYFLALGAAVTACSSAPRHPDRIAPGDYGYARADLAWTVRQAMGKYGVKGISLAVVDDQQIIMAEGFGQADAARDIPATAETLYRVGSISKLFTALEVVRLVEQGRLDLDRDIAEYVPRFAVRSRFEKRPITARSLLAHHSGLPSDLLRGMWVERPHSLEQLVDDLHEESLASPPQTQFKYSNIGYSVLGRAVEVALGRPFVSAMRDEILLPLGMSRSSFEPLPGLASETSKGYRGGVEVRPYVLRDEPAGGLLSSVSDMARFLRLVFASGRIGDSRLLSEGALDEMFRPQFTGLSLDFGHEEGLGFNLSGLSASGRRIAWHMGEYPPFFATLALLRDEKLGVVVLANSSEARHFAGNVAVKALELGLEAKLGIAPTAAPAASRSEFKVDPAAIARRAGRYVVRGQLTDVKNAGDHLVINLGGSDLDLVPIGPDRFVPEKRAFLGLFRFSLSPIEVEFADVAGHSVAVLRGLPAPVPCERVDPGPIPPAWRARFGVYAPEDLSGERFVIRDVRVEEDAGILVARVRSSGTTPDDPTTETRVALRPVSDDEAVIAGLGDGAGATVRVLSRPTGNALRYSGFTFVAAR